MLRVFILFLLLLPCLANADIRIGAVRIITGSENIYQDNKFSFANSDLVPCHDEHYFQHLSETTLSNLVHAKLNTAQATSRRLELRFYLTDNDCNGTGEIRRTESPLMLYGSTTESYRSRLAALVELVDRESGELLTSFYAQESTDSARTTRESPLFSNARATPADYSERLNKLLQSISDEINAQVKGVQDE